MMFHNIIILFNYFSIINNNFLIIIHPRADQYFLHTQNVQCAWWNMNCLFSVDLMPIDVRIYMFLNKTPTNNFPFASFPLVQLLLIVLSVNVTYISNGSLQWVAYSQGRVSAGSRAHLVIESGPSNNSHILTFCVSRLVYFLSLLLLLSFLFEFLLHYPLLLLSFIVVILCNNLEFIFVIQSLSLLHSYFPLAP